MVIVPVSTDIDIFPKFRPFLKWSLVWLWGPFWLVWQFCKVIVWLLLVLFALSAWPILLLVFILRKNKPNLKEIWEKVNPFRAWMEFNNNKVK